MVHTASMPAPWCCEPVLCCGGLTWGTDSSSSFSGSHRSVSSGFFPAFWKRKSTKGSACRQGECWEHAPHQLSSSTLPADGADAAFAQHAASAAL